MGTWEVDPRLVSLLFLRPFLLSHLWPRQCSQIRSGSWALTASDLGQIYFLQTSWQAQLQGMGCSFGTLAAASPIRPIPGVLYFAIAGSISLSAPLLETPSLWARTHHSAPFKRKKETRDGDLGVWKGGILVLEGLGNDSGISWVQHFPATQEHGLAFSFRSCISPLPFAGLHFLAFRAEEWETLFSAGFPFGFSCMTWFVQLSQLMTTQEAIHPGWCLGASFPTRGPSISKYFLRHI